MKTANANHASQRPQQAEFSNAAKKISALPAEFNEIEDVKITQIIVRCSEVT